jgi:choline dehydrogenase-like flavoprotein
MQDNNSSPKTELSSLSIAWRDWIESLDFEENLQKFDAIVVGSGYGGSVAALRLTQSGFRVLMLERGSEYLPGNFANQIGALPNQLRVDRPEGPPLGRATGLFEFRVGLNMVSLVANGLGGGSLINAGVAIKPQQEVFAQEAWPHDIRTNNQASDGLLDLDAAFTLAKKTLQVSASTFHNGIKFREEPLLKVAALDRLGSCLKRDVRAQAVELTIDSDACTRCGDCFTGCNVIGAKKTLRTTYLAQAFETGKLQIVTSAQVYKFSRLGSGDAQRGWTLSVFSTETQHEKIFVAEAADPSNRRSSNTAREIQTPLLIVAAGTFGSTELLQRSQSLVGSDLSFSPTLGSKLSANGDLISANANEKREVNAIGYGSNFSSQPHFKTAPTKNLVGPTITSMLDLRFSDMPLEQRVLIQDGAVPGTIAEMFEELISTNYTLAQLGKYQFKTIHGSQGKHDPLGASAALVKHTQLLLSMGHDGSKGRVVWLQGQDISVPYWDDPANLTTYKIQQDYFDQAASLGQHLHTPAWQFFPKSASAIMAGPELPKSIVTVHPLGGCAMADSADLGVTNHIGQVWIHNPGFPGRTPKDSEAFAGRPQLYQGLYILDGSIIPTSLGCNPLLTITAIAERAIARIITNLNRPAKEPEQIVLQTNPDRHPKPLSTPPVPIEAVMKETLTCESFVLTQRQQNDRPRAIFDAEFRSPDISTTMTERHHQFSFSKADLRIAFKENTVKYSMDQSKLDLATFRALPVGKFSAGYWHLIFATLYFLATLVSALLATYSVLPEMPLSSISTWHWFIAFVSTMLLTGIFLILYLPLSPFARTVATWYILRGRKDFHLANARRAENSLGKSAFEKYEKSWLRFTGGFKQMLHASEIRVMRYSIPLKAVTPTQGWPENIHIYATKRVQYPASNSQLYVWLIGMIKFKLYHAPRPGQLRPSYWAQIMDANVFIYSSSRASRSTLLGKGVFKMGLDNLLSQDSFQLGKTGDTSRGIFKLGAYPMLFLRYGFKTRLFEFRLPAYARRIVQDNSPAHETELRLFDIDSLVKPNGLTIAPKSHWIDVERGFSSSDRGTESQEPLKLRLWQYQQGTNELPLAPAIASNATWMGQPVSRAKVVLLLHAFGQSGLSYTLKEIPQNLAERFFHEGWEVWILESRMSTRSGYAEQPCNVDMQAQYDVPEAVKYIVKNVSRRITNDTSNAPIADLPPVQISLFGQCIGAASMWMAILSGRLSHDRAAIHGKPALSMVSHCMSSQVHPWLSGTSVTESKTWLPGILDALSPKASIPFSVRTDQPNFIEALTDRIFASMEIPDEERCPQCETDHDADAEATCRRIRFIEAPLYKHRNINNATHTAMPRLFGPANVRLFSHARRFVEQGYKRLVDEDGANRYVVDENILTHGYFPVQLLHGEQNELFDCKNSLYKSHAELSRTLGAWQNLVASITQSGQNQRTKPTLEPICIQGYGHLDVLIGKTAYLDVYGQVLKFFNAVFDEKNHTVTAPNERTEKQLQAPLAGPFLGWIRQENGNVKARVSFVLDDINANGFQSNPKWDLAQTILKARSLKAADEHLIPREDDFDQYTNAKLYCLDQSGIRTPIEANFKLHNLLGINGSNFSGDHGIVYRIAWADFDVPKFHSNDIHKFQVLAERSGFPATNLSASNLATENEFSAAQKGIFSISKASALATRSAVESVTFAISCCRHTGLTFDSNRIDDSVERFIKNNAALPLEHQAAFCLLLGDQIYADATAGMMDPASPIEKYYERHIKAFTTPWMSKLLSSLPVYMTPDDHEWTNNFPHASPLLKEAWPDNGPNSAFTHREQEQAFKIAARSINAFQRLQSPAIFQSHYMFDSSPARFFVMDTRYERNRDKALGQSKIVSKRTIRAFRRWLIESHPSSLNVLASGSVIFPGLINAAAPEKLDTWQSFPEQRALIVALIRKYSASGFLLLSGDYHVSGHAEITENDHAIGIALIAPPIYAPLTYANANPEDVIASETLSVTGGALISSECAGISRGSGFGTVNIERQVTLEGSYNFFIHYSRDLYRYEETPHIMPMSVATSLERPLIQAGKRKPLREISNTI